jgi:hypothetical protein
MNDFQTFYEIGIFAVTGSDIYQAAPSTSMVVHYLPIFALIMSVFSLLPLPVAAGIWTFGKLLAVGFLLHQVTKVPIETINGNRSDETYKNLHICIAVLGIGTSLIADFALGQFNTYLAAGFLAIWLLGRTSSKRNMHFSSFIFAIISSKLTPLALLPVVILKRNWSLAFWMLVYTIGLNLAAAAIIGLPLSELLLSLNATAAEHKLSVGELTNIKNQALVSIFGRFYLEFVDQTLPKFFALFIVALAATIFTGLLLNYLKGNHERGRSELSLRDVSVAILISLVLSPDTRTAHLVQLVLPVLLLSGWCSSLVAKVLIGCTLAFVGFSGTTLIGDDGLEFIRSYSLQGITILALVGVLLSRPVMILARKFNGNDNAAGC